MGNGIVTEDVKMNKNLIISVHQLMQLMIITHLNTLEHHFFAKSCNHVGKGRMKL